MIYSLKMPIWCDLVKPRNREMKPTIDEILLFSIAKRPRRHFFRPKLHVRWIQVPGDGNTSKSCKSPMGHLWASVFWWKDCMNSIGYGSIPINTIFRGMNIHKSQLFWCSPKGYQVLTHCQLINYLVSLGLWNPWDINFMMSRTRKVTLHTDVYMFHFNIDSRVLNSTRFLCGFGEIWPGNPTFIIDL